MKNSERLIPLLWSVLILTAAALPLHSGATTFSDDSFADTDWILAGQMSSLSGYVLEAYGGHESVGGNPANYRGAGTFLQAQGIVYGVHAYRAQSYAPSVSGAIDSLAFKFDTALKTDPNNGGMLFFPALAQQTTDPGVFDIFVASAPAFWARTGTGNWSTWSFSGLIQSDFAMLDHDGVTILARPDFSANGRSIRFGFGTYNGSPGGNQYNFAGGVDNWSVTVISAPVPEPEIYWMLLVGLAFIGRRLRRVEGRAASGLACPRATALTRAAVGSLRLA